VILTQLPDSWTSTGAYAIVPVENGYHIEQISEWQISQFTAMGRYFSLQNVGDTNQNGLPEIVLEVQTGSSGIPGAEEMVIQHIEWSPVDGRFTNKQFPVYWQSCDDPCTGGWEFKNLDTEAVLITHSDWATRDDCPNLVTQAVSPWDGTQYVPGKLEIVPPADDLSPECRLGWAEAAILVDQRVRDAELQPGWKNDLAISIIENAVQDWPASADELWGPAGRDAFKLQLGLLYELRGEDKKAISLLQHLAKSPTLSEYDFMSRLANIYLQYRRKEGKTSACLKIEDAYTEELLKIAPDLDMDLEKSVRDTWGLVGWHRYSICNPSDMLPADMRSEKITNPKSLLSWLKKSGIKIYQQEKIDLNGDGEDDYLIFLDAYESDDPDVWAFFASPKGYLARYVYDFWPESDQSKLEIEPLRVDPALPVY
jgi:hypothetical protein